MGPTKLQRLQINKMLCERAFYVSSLGSHNFSLGSLVFQFVIHWSVNNFANTRECTEQLQALATLTSDEIIRYFADFTAGFFSYTSGEHVPAREYFERALKLSNNTRRVLIKDPIAAVGFVNCTGFLGHSLWMLGYPDQARKQHARMLDLLGEPIDAFARGAGITNELFMFDFMRDNRPMLEAGERLVTLARESGSTYFLGGGMIWLGRARAVEGAFNRGMEAIAEGREILIGLGELATLDMNEHNAATAYLEAGRTDEGLAIVEGTIEKCVAGGVRIYEADLHRLKGEFLLAAGAQMTDAEDSFRKAITIAQRQQAKSWELRATLSLTRLLMKQNRRDEARRTLTDIYNWFTEGFDTADLKDAKALVEELGG